MNLEFAYIIYSTINHNLFEMISLIEYEKLETDMKHNFITISFNNSIVRDYSQSIILFQEMLRYIQLNMNFIIDKYQFPSNYNYKQIITHISNIEITKRYHRMGI
jgi:hypothetical protein